ncbi:MAG: hypothetical protein RI953_419 [Pseudomonadota bacterium]|jgi:hypothetical protein
MISARKIALLAVIASQSNAFADEKSDKDIQKSVVPYGLIQAYSNVADSQYSSAPDFTMAILRFGMKVSEGITRAQFETAVWGNVAETGDVPASAVGFNGVGIRRADVGLALSSGTTISLGRIRMGGADAWGVDATAAAEQFGSIDGASIVQKLSLGDKNELSFSLGIGNSMGNPSGKDTHTFGRSLKSDRGVIVGARANVLGGVVATAYYGMEKNQIAQESAAEQAVLDAEGKPVAGQFVKLKKVITARDASHFEGSLGYNKDNYAVGGWYQSVVRSDLKLATFVDNKLTTSPITDADAKYGAKVGPKTTSSILGFGFNTDSSLLGYTDVLQKGALLTFGGSVAKLAERDGVSSNDSEEAKNDITQVALGVGYQSGGFALELGNEFQSSTAQSFNSKNKEQGSAAAPSKTSAYKTYLVGIYSF